MNVVPYQPEHLQDLILQPAQAMLQPMMRDREYADQLAQTSEGYTWLVDGKVIACLGVIPIWENRAAAWGLIGENARRHLTFVHRGVRRFLDLTQYRRVETPVSTNFVEGHRWARMLGFVNEGTMRAYMPDGSDCDLYARIK